MGYMLRLNGERISTHPSFELSMSNSTATPLPGVLLLANQLELVSTTTVAGTFYGIAFTLFCLYVHSLAPRLRDEDRKRQAKFMLVYSAVIMLCGLYNLVSNAWVTQNAYIKHADYLGGPILYIESTFRSDRGIAVGFACQVAVDILTSAIQVHRCFSPLYLTCRLNSEQGLACMGHLECH
jgi:amino acid transporter